MKPFRHFLSATILCFAGILIVQAQESEPLLAVSNPTLEATSKRKASPSIDFTKGQTQAQFKNLQNYVANNIKYPEIAQKNSLEGSVSVLVHISEQGKITDAKVIQSLGLGCDEAALDLVSNMPTWTPASNAGVFVKSKQVIEINFRLQ